MNLPLWSLPIAMVLVSPIVAAMTQTIENGHPVTLSYLLIFNASIAGVVGLIYGYEKISGRDITWLEE